MPLMTYGGFALLVRNGAIGTSVACCCGCPVGTVVPVAWYWYPEDYVIIGKESEYYQPIIDEYDTGLHYGFDLRVVYWIGNPSESEVHPVTGEPVYEEFQVWTVFQCCPDRECDSAYLEFELEEWTSDWTDKIRDVTLQHTWDPPWAIGSCAGLGLTDDSGVSNLFRCTKDSISFPNNPAQGQFILRNSLEVCCEDYY